MSRKWKQFSFPGSSKKVFGQRNYKERQNRPQKSLNKPQLTNSTLNESIVDDSDHENNSLEEASSSVSAKSIQPKQRRKGYSMLNVSVLESEGGNENSPLAKRKSLGMSFSKLSKATNGISKFGFRRTSNSMAKNSSDIMSLNQNICDFDEESNDSQRLPNELNINEDSIDEMLSEKQPTMTSTSSSESTLPSKLSIDSFKADRRKCGARPNGLVSKLRQAVKQSKSDLQFWINDRTAPRVLPSEFLRIEEITHTFDRILVRTSSGSKENKFKLFCVDRNCKDAEQLRVGKILEAQFDLPGHRIDDNTVFYVFVNKINCKIINEFT